MNLVERYIAAVQRELPSNKRDDISRELKANIMDEIDELEAEHGPLNNDQVNALLIKMGHPRAVARQFCPPAPLVSARLMPLYLNTLYMVLGVLFVISSLEIATRWLSGAEMGILLYLKALASHFLNASYFAFTWVTIGFIVLTRDRKYADDEAKNTNPDIGCKWSPAELPSAANSWQHISLQHVFSDLATLLFLALIIWYPILRPGPNVASIFSQPIWSVLLWFTPIIAIAVISSLWQLRTRLWSRSLLMLNAAINSAFFGLALWVLLNAPILRISAANWQGNISLTYIERGVFFVVLFVAAVALYEVIRDVLRLRKLNQQV